MGYQIHLGKAGRCDIPVFCLDGDMMFEQGSWLGATIEFSFELVSSTFQMPVDGGRADSQKPGFQAGRQMESLSNPGHPQRQQGFEAY